MVRGFDSRPDVPSTPPIIGNVGAPTLAAKQGARISAYIAPGGERDAQVLLNRACLGTPAFQAFGSLSDAAAVPGQW
jgi:hypothetical protein